MSGDSHKTCYGTMFPETLYFDNDRPMVGKVFRYQLSRAGGTFRSDRTIAVNLEEWDMCRQCPDFDHCYRLSLGKLALETAIGGR